MSLEADAFVDLADNGGILLLVGLLNHHVLPLHQHWLLVLDFGFHVAIESRLRLFGIRDVHEECVFVAN